MYVPLAVPKELIEIEVENVFPKEVSYGTLLVDPLNAI